MDELVTLMNEMPFVSDIGIEITAAADGCATGQLKLEPRHSSVPHRTIAHGGVTYALADTVGGAAVLSVCGQPTPTIDMRIDYLTPAQTALVAEATVVRNGGTVSVVEIHISDADGIAVADARGVYKTSGGSGDTAWGSIKRNREQ